ncbi:hypothetical protein D3C79_632340 [compost metagenome]
MLVEQAAEQGRQRQQDPRVTKLAGAQSQPGKQEGRQTVVAKQHGVEQGDQQGTAPEPAIFHHPARQRPERNPLSRGRTGFRQPPTGHQQQHCRQHQQTAEDPEIAKPLGQQAAAHQPQHGAEGERHAHHREDPRQIAALIAVAQHGLGHHGSHGGAEGRDDPGQQQHLELIGQQRQQGADAIGEQTCQHGGTPPDQIAEPAPADHTHRKRQKIDRQGLGCLPLAHPELGGDLGQRRAVDGLHHLGKHHQSHHQPARWQLVVHDKPPSQEVVILERCRLSDYNKQDYIHQESDTWPLFFPITLSTPTS